MKPLQFASAIAPLALAGPPAPVLEPLVETTRISDPIKAKFAPGVLLVLRTVAKAMVPGFRREEQILMFRFVAPE
jgi:hypothetical protein